MESIFSVLLGLIIAWTILMYFPAQQTKVSYFTMDPWPLEMDDSNLALIGVGLEARAPAPPSVMDASPASSAQVVMMEEEAPSPMAPSPASMMMGDQGSNSPAAMSPAAMSMSPISLTPAPAPSA